MTSTPGLPEEVIGQWALEITSSAPVYCVCAVGRLASAHRQREHRGVGVEGKTWGAFGGGAGLARGAPDVPRSPCLGLNVTPPREARSLPRDCAAEGEWCTMGGRVGDRRSCFCLWPEARESATGCAEGGVCSPPALDNPAQVSSLQLPVLFLGPAPSALKDRPVSCFAARGHRPSPDIPSISLPLQRQDWPASPHCPSAPWLPEYRAHRGP